MVRINWDSPGERLAEFGLDRGVLYPAVGPGVPWHGLMSVKEDSEASGSNLLYLDGRPYRTQKVEASFSASLQAYTYPIEFEEALNSSGDISDQRSQQFGFAYRTYSANDTVGADHSYMIHLVYNALAVPSAVDNHTYDTKSIAAANFSWTISTSPMPIPGAKSAAHLIIDAGVMYQEALSQIEDIIYGTDTEFARLPTPEELIAMVESEAILLIIDHGDGTWTAQGPDEIIQMMTDTSFRITWPSAVYLTQSTYQISSL